MSDKPPPTRMNQQVFKGKKKAAVGGFKLLKKKADALKAKFRDYAKAIAATKGTMADDTATAFFSLTQAEYAAGDFKKAVLEGNMVAKVRVTSAVDNVAGVKLPVFNMQDTGAVNENQSLGLVGGGKKIAASRTKFETVLKNLIKLASLQTSFVTLDEAMKVTNRRVNALENVTIPRIEGILDYISRELDELEREDFTRLKKVQASKEERLKEEQRLKEEETREAMEKGIKPKVMSVNEDIMSKFESLDGDEVLFK
eukprot:CAMPEP_0118651390 /NCGR_PEP_ID=MMETSP0785-20121206/10761_1 /TAXON_ID=91992 /ORGANISM="Bolidomonas pacifica, Strain CCMP 1866" /LENGTH=255 /DNA_ID=CAMNT_0006543841 /DNA_START=30 /DNA_END=795 /DNA_ORIENTATION=-